MKKTGFLLAVEGFGMTLISHVGWMALGQLMKQGSPTNGTPVVEAVLFLVLVLLGITTWVVDTVTGAKVISTTMGKSGMFLYLIVYSSTLLLLHDVATYQLTYVVLGGIVLVIRAVTIAKLNKNT